MSPIRTRYNRFLRALARLRGPWCAMAVPAGLCLVLLVPAVPAPARASDSAHFVVGEQVVNPDLAPFAATIVDIGNGHRLLGQGGFEPRVFRNRLTVTEGANDRIIADPAEISGWDSWRSGAFDGAEIEVLRIENGAFRSVRTDRIPPGGFHASGWTRIEKASVVPAGRTRFTFSFPRWGRPEARYYFTVRAVDRRGAQSVPAAAVSASSPVKVEKADIDNALERMKVSQDPSRRLAAPQNLQARRAATGAVELSWDPVPGAAGYALYRSDYPPEEHRGYYIDLGHAGPRIREGDMVILRHRLFRSDRGTLLTNRVWDTNIWKTVGSLAVRGWSDDAGSGNWQLVRHEPDTPVEEPGETYLRATLGPGQQMDLGGYNNAGTSQGFYAVLDPARSYRFEVWARGRAAQPLRFELTGFHSRNPGVAPVVFRVTPEWRKYTATFRVPRLQEDGKAGKMRLQLTGPGEIDLDNFRIFRADAPFLGLVPEEAARLRASGMGALRTHAFSRTGRGSYDLEQLTNPRGASSIHGGNTLPQTLALIAAAGADPWLQIEPHFSEAEWLGLAEYLAAPFDPARDDPAELPWAAKRHAQGQVMPWVDRFDRILFEVGNETWNRIFAPWSFKPMQDAATWRRYDRGEVYGLYQEYVLSILRQSPYWPRLEGRLVPLLGGWNRHDYGLSAAAVSPNSQLLTHAGYNGGWDEGEGPVRPTPQGYFSVLTNAAQNNRPRSAYYAAAAAKLSRKRPAPLQLGTYEAGPGYALNGLNRSRVTPEQAAMQEEAMKSVAAGTATLDAFLANAAEGLVLQNFFAFGAGERWNSHARWYQGGQEYPSWMWLSLFNREALGDMLAVETVAAPRADLPEVRHREALPEAPLVAAYATRADDRLALVLISRRVPGYPVPGDDGVTGMVTVDLPIAGADRLTLYRMNGDYTAHNVASEQARIVAQPQAVPDTLPRLNVRDLPPGEALLYLFEGIR